MSGSLVLGVVGAVVGTLTGVGPAIGWAIGSAIGALAFPPKVPGVQGPRLSDLKVQANQYGTALGIVKGRIRKGGSLIWAVPLIERESTQGGGKGGPPTPSQTTFSYYASYAVLLCETDGMPIVGIRRIWDSVRGQVVYDADSSSSISSQTSSNDFANCMTVYTGSDTQLPDATMESYLGVGNAPAYRNRAYVVFNNLPMDQFSNRIPQLEFEIISEGTILGPRKFTQKNSAFFTDAAGPGTLAPIRTNAEKGLITFGVYGHLKPWSILYHFDYDLNFISQESLPLSSQYQGYMGDMGPEPVFLDDYTIPLNRRLRVGDAIVAENKSPNYFADVGALRGACLKDGKLYVLTTLDYSLGRITMTKYEWGSLGLRAIDSNEVTNFFANLADLAMSPYGSFPGGFFAVENDQETVWYCEPTSNTVQIGRINDDLTISFLVSGLAVTGGANSVQASASDGVLVTVSVDLGADGYAVSNNIGIWTRQPAISHDTVSLASVVTDICTYKNASSEESLTSADLDVTELTDLINGYAIAQQTTIRSAIEQLAQAYFFDAVESDGKIKFVKRGQPSIVTIPDNDLGATNQSENLPLLTIVRQQEVEVPSSVVVVYNDAANSYQVATQQSRRLNVRAGGPLNIELPIVLSADKAKQITDVLRIDATLAKDKYSWITSRKYAIYEPTDVMTVRGNALRVTDKTETPDGLIRWDGFADDPRNYTKTYPGASWTAPVAEVPASAGPSHLTPLDITLLRDEDDGDNGFYAAIQGYLGGWTGAVVDKSADNGQTYTRVAQTTTSTPVGMVLTVLGMPYTSAAWFDEINTVTVNLPVGVTLSSLSRDSLLANQELNNILIGSEVIRYRNAQLSGDNYILSGLLRGQRGTEWAFDTHVVNERAIVLDVGALRRIALVLSELNANRLYRTTSLGAVSGELTTFANTGLYRKPYSAVLLGAGKAGNGDILLDWVRRTRVGGAWEESVDASLGETSEIFDVEIWDAGFVTLKRTITVSTESATYTNANQITDFGGTQYEVHFKVYQVSSTYGRGYPAQADEFFGSSYRTLIIGDSPISYWRLGETSGHFIDMMGNFDSYSEDVNARNQSSLISGDANGCVLLSGTAPSQILIDNSFSQITTIWSFEAWVKPNSLTGHITIVGRNSSSWGGGLAAFYFKLSNAGDQKPTIVLSYATSSEVHATATNAISTGSIYHIVGTCDGTNLKIYVNGVLEGTTSTGGNTIGAQTGPLVLGASGGSVDNYNGYLDEIAVYSYALTQAQVTAHYAAGA